MDIEIIVNVDWMQFKHKLNINDKDIAYLKHLHDSNLVTTSIDAGIDALKEEINNSLYINGIPDNALSMYKDEVESEINDMINDTVLKDIMLENNETLRNLAEHERNEREK